MKRILGLLFLSFCAAAMADDPVLNLSARQRYPWNGKVDVSFTITGETEENYLSITATNAATGATIPVRTIFDAGGAAVTPRTVFAPGAVSLVWDAGADAPGIVADEVALSVVAVPPPPPLYLVVDLSAGADAASYPVSCLADVPAGGWTDEYKTTKLVLRRIEAGSFTMGSPAGEVGRYDDYEAQHEVSLTKAFWIGVYELTQRQWELVMGNKPSYFSNASYYAARPVEQVSYNDIRGSSSGAQWPASNAVDASSFMGRLRARTGLEFDLPTEAQWEYACRAGTTTALNSGKNLTDTESDANMDEVGRYLYNGGSGFSSSCTTANGTAKVGSYLPNAWGLYDMHGNVYEWCLDWWQSSLGTSAVTDPKGASSGSYRVERGGGWYYAAQDCRSAIRCSIYCAPSGRSSYLGFRPVSILP